MDKPMIRKIMYSLFLSCILISQTQALSDSVNIEIADLEGAGFTPNEIAMISDKLRSSIIECSNFHIVEKVASDLENTKQNRFEAVFDDTVPNFDNKKHSKSNLFLLTGRLSRANTITALSVRIVNARTDEIIYAKIKEYVVQFKDLVSLEIPKFTKDLISGIDSTLEILTMQEEKGVLYIESEPENGTIHVDGIQTTLTTPATIKDIDAGGHSVSVNSGGKIGSKNIIITPGKLLKTVVKLKNGFGSLRILSTVPGITVDIDTIGRYTTPVEIDSLPAGKYVINSVNDGYFSIYDTINITCENTTEINLTPERLSFLQINGVTDDSKVTLDKAKLDLNVTTLYMVVPGEHVLSIERGGFFSRSFRLKTFPGDTTAHTVHYAPHPAALSILSVPEKASITLNDRLVGQTPGVFPSIIPGTYKLQLTHRQYEPIEMNLNLVPGSKMEITESFKVLTNQYLAWNRKKQLLTYTNVVLAGSGQLILSHNAPAIAIFSAGLLSDMAILAASYQLHEHNMDYMNAMSFNDVNYYHDKRNKDRSRLTTAIISSVSLRGLSILLTHLTKF
jgi:hypothetical protein